MKKVLPFVFPLIALVIVAFLAYRWYNLNTKSKGVVGDASQGVQVDDLSDAERERIVKGSGDFKTVSLQGAAPAQGSVRYEDANGKISFSVMADLPATTSGTYQVWLVNPVTQATQKAFVLEQSKGGYLGSAAISDSLLPLDVVVSLEKTDDNTIENVVLRGTLPKQE